MFDVIVVGKGMMGSAAARYLSAAGAHVALIGQDEPTDYAAHDGVFASHYDAGRLTHRLARDEIWARLAVQSIEQYAAIEQQSGIRFHTPRGGLSVARDLDGNRHLQQRDRIAEQFDIPYITYRSSDELQRAHPVLRFPAGFMGIFEPAPAGFIDPRALVRAQTAIAANQGAEVMSELVVNVEITPQGVRATTRSGRSVAGQQIVLACGAFANTYQLLPRQLAIRVKTETIILAELGEPEAERLATMPTVVYQIESPELVDIYMTPPIRYPDGKCYIKMGCDTASDQTLPDLQAMQDWMRHGNADSHKPAMTAALHSIIPELRTLSVRARGCLVTYTTHGKPYIDQIAERVYVATGGNGSSAKCSDTLGWLAAQLVLGQPWGAFEREAFRATYSS